MAKLKFFGSQIEPACEYCQNGYPTKDGQMILCEKHGAVAPYFSCRHFCYSPLLRKPRPTPKPPEFDPSDFKL